MPILSPLKMHCKSKSYAAFCNDISNCFLINPGAKIPSLFSLLPNVIIRSNALPIGLIFQFLKWSFSLNWTLAWFGKHYKMSRVEDKKSLSYFKAFEINHRKQHGSSGCQRELMWVGWRMEGGETSLPHTPGEQALHSNDCLLLSSLLSAGYPAESDTAE